MYVLVKKVKYKKLVGSSKSEAGEETECNVSSSEKCSVVDGFTMNKGCEQDMEYTTNGSKESEDMEDCDFGKSNNCEEMVVDVCENENGEIKIDGSIKFEVSGGIKNGIYGNGKGEEKEDEVFKSEAYEEMQHKVINSETDNIDDGFGMTKACEDLVGWLFWV